MAPLEAFHQHLWEDGLKPIKRSDVGKQRKIDDDLSEKITYYVKEYQRLPATQIYEKLINNNEITSKEVSLSTITRFVSNLTSLNCRILFN